MRVGLYPLKGAEDWLFRSIPGVKGLDSSRAEVGRGCLLDVFPHRPVDISGEGSVPHRHRIEWILLSCVEVELATLVQKSFVQALKLDSTFIDLLTPNF